MLDTSGPKARRALFAPKATFGQLRSGWTIQVSRLGILARQQMPLDENSLQAGDLVRVKSYQYILSTLDTKGKNRGLHFDAELVPYCGKIFRVRTRIERFVDENTGVMRTLKTPAVILDG